MVGLGTPFAKLHWAENATPTNDKVLILSDKDGAKANKLHAKAEGTLWALHFEDGRLPEPLKQRWTKYSNLLKATKEYYALKKIEITEE